jgi:hypothetical protein
VVTDAAGVQVGATINPATSPTAVTGLAPNVKYNFSVVLTGSNATPAPATTVSYTTDALGAVNVVTANPTDSTMDVSWTMQTVTATSALKVYDATGVTPVAATVGAITCTGAACSAKVSGLAADTTFTFKVEAKGSNNVVATPVASATGKTTALLLGGLTPATVSTSQINLSWTAPTVGAVSSVSVFDAAGVNPVATAAVGAVTCDAANVCSVSVNNLTGNTTYTFKLSVTGVGGAHVGTASAVGTTNVGVATFAAPAAVTTNSAVVNWTMPAGGAQTQSMTLTAVGATGTVNTVVLSTASLGANGVSLSNLAQNTDYTFTVVLTGANGSTTTQVVHVLTNADPATGVTIPQAGMTAVGNTISANVSWTNPAGAGSSVLTVKSAAGVFATIPVAGNTQVVTGLTPGVNYTFEVVFTGISGVPAAAASNTAWTLAILNPATIGKAAITGTNQVSLNWIDNSLGATGYQVQYTSNNGRTWTTAPVVTATLSSATVTVALNRQALYQFRVLPVAVNTNQTGPLSGVTTIDLRIPPADVTQTQAAADPVATVPTVNISWQLNSNNAATVTVQRRMLTAGGRTAWATVATLPGNALQYLDTGVVKGSTYQYRVRTSNSQASSNWSQAFPVAGVTVP